MKGKAIARIVLFSMIALVLLCVLLAGLGLSSFAKPVSPRLFLSSPPEVNMNLPQGKSVRFSSPGHRETLTFSLPTRIPSPSSRKEAAAAAWWCGT